MRITLRPINVLLVRIGLSELNEFSKLIVVLSRLLIDLHTNVTLNTELFTFGDSTVIYVLHTLLSIIVRNLVHMRLNARNSHLKSFIDKL